MEATTSHSHAVRLQMGETPSSSAARDVRPPMCFAGKLLIGSLFLISVAFLGMVAVTPDKASMGVQQAAMMSNRASVVHAAVNHYVSRSKSDKKELPVGLEETENEEVFENEEQKKIMKNMGEEEERERSDRKRLISQEDEAREMEDDRSFSKSESSEERKDEQIKMILKPRTPEEIRKREEEDERAHSDDYTDLAMDEGEDEQELEHHGQIQESETKENDRKDVDLLARESRAADSSEKRDIEPDHDSQTFQFDPSLNEKDDSLDGYGTIFDGPLPMNF